MKSNRLALSICCVFAVASATAQAAGPIAKQLSGPPEEFAAMRAPSPVDAAIYSKSALIPIQMESDATGQGHWQVDFPVENGRTRFMVFSGGADWRVNMAASGEKFQEPRSLSESAQPADFGIEQASVPGSFFSLENIQSGTYLLDVSGGSVGSRGFLLVEGDPATELVSYRSGGRQWVGERIGINAAITSKLRDDSVQLGKGMIDRAQLRVTAPDGSQTLHPMFDDGQHDDGAAGDGVYGGDFPANVSGDYVAQVDVQAHDGRGQHVVRTAEHVVPVVANELKLRADAVAAGRATGGTRLALGIDVNARNSEQHFRAYAEVWGSSKFGTDIPVAWVSGMVTPQNGQLDLGLDQRWIARAGAKAPFELRNVRIEDPDNFITLASADRMALEMPAIRFGGQRVLAVDEAMRMGPRPPADQVTRGVGSRLLLIHGYCSGGVWPTSQFSNASSFLDVNKNRSHDAFARLIQSFGATWNSFGTVSHSQGGAASLHLYTYYWSGLDNATGSRLMQSVGTPYKGTNLSGILAALGNWFGVGCGTNSDMTYSGASAWLAGIPTSSRAKVNYYTTSFRYTNWWSNDYCNFATDLVLSDPEDGTTEQTNGQLSGGVNRGHTTGQCHTAGMRDPAQYLDSSRNATMNANAAR